MKRVSNNQHSRHGFTIIELLTVMSIIIILISLLVPSLNRVRRYAMDVKQRAQLHSIAVALDLFNSEFEGYPDSNAYDSESLRYCGAMKLAEAMVGQDLKGFNPTSRFLRRGFPSTLGVLPYIGMPYPPYNTCGGAVDIPCYNENIRSRKMYLQLENANVYQIKDIYVPTAGGAPTSYNSFEPNTFVLCDSYNRVTHTTTGKKIGMPILYYKANISMTQHMWQGRNSGQDWNIYDARDNLDLINMGLPWFAGPSHPMAENGGTISGATATPQVFYDKTRDNKVSGNPWPVRADSYILMSAGFDGEYGTNDDIYNFSD